MKFRYNLANIGPIPLTDLSPSITAGPAGIQFVSIVAQNQTITYGPAQIELQDSDEAVKSFTDGQLRQLIDDGIITVDVPPTGSLEYIPASPPDWQIPPPTTIFEGLDQAADIASSYRDGTALGIKLADGSNIGDATHRVAELFASSVSVDTSFSIKVGIVPVVTVDATTFTINEALVVTGGATVNELTVGSLAGVLKAVAGFVSGSANTDDLPEGIINLYYTDARARAAHSATTPLNYNSITGNHDLAGLTSFGTADQLVTVNSSATGWEYKTLVGTADQINVVAGLGLLTLSTPQNIAMSSSPTFAGLTIGSLTGVLKATAGLVSGSANTDDLPEGSTNKYFSDVAVDTRIDLQKGQPNGLATLDGLGKVPIIQLPDGIGDGGVFIASSEPAMLGLPAKKGDIAVRDDINKTYGLSALPPTNPLNWIEFLAVGTVSSINGMEGAVALTTNEIPEGPGVNSNKYFTDERVDDRVAALLQAGAGDITWFYDDGLNTLAGVISLATKTTDDLIEGATNKYFSDELVDARVSSLLVAGTNIQLSYNEFANTLTISADLPDTVLAETVDDRVNELIIDSPTVIWTYDDNANTLTAAVSLATFDTDDIIEGATNLYYTADRVEGDVGTLLVAGTNVTIDLAPGTITINSNLNVPDFNQLVVDLIDDSPTISWVYNGSTSLVGNVNLATFDTDDLAEGLGNIYYTSQRVFDDLSNILIAGTNITLTPGMGPNSITIDAVFTGPNTFEEVDDRVAGLIINGTGLSWSYNDGAGTLQGNVTLSPFDTDNLAEGLTRLYYTDERVDDRVAALLVAGTNITLTYNDNGALPGTITVDALFTGPMSFDDVDDRVANLIQNGLGLNWTYDDNAGTLTGDVDIGAFLTTQIPEGVPYYTFDEFDNPVAYFPGLYFTPSRGEGAILNMTTVQNTVGAGTKWRVTYPDIQGPYLETSTPRPMLHVDLDIQDGPGITWAFHTYTQAEPYDSAQATINLNPFTTDDLAEGSVNKYFTLAGIGEIIDDRVATLLVAGPGISLNYDDTSNQLTVTAFLAAYSDEQARDAVAAMIQPSADGAITWVHADSLNTLTPTFHIDQFTTDDLPQGITNLYMSLENVDDRVAALLTNVPGVGLTWTYNDPSGSLTGNVTLAPFDTDDLAEGTNPDRLYFTQERSADATALLIQDGPGISWFYDDTNGMLIPTVSLGGFTTDDISEGATNLYYTDERVDDRVAALILNGIGLTWTYSDVANTLTGNVSLSTFTTDDLNEGITRLYFTNERVDDRVASLLVAGTNVTLTYDDTLNTLTIDSTGGGGGGDSTNVVTVTSTPYTTLADDGVIIADATSIGVPTFTINLITAVGNSGKKFHIKKQDATIRSIRILPTLSQTIDGLGDLYLISQNQSISIVSDGVNWQTI